MQTILGAGGAIGKSLAKELTSYTSDIRLVNRNPVKVNESDQLFPADLTDSAQINKAIKGSEIVYVTIGFPYSYKVWNTLWPSLIKNVIQGCRQNNAKLVFFDNMYMYDPDYLDGMDERTPVNPISKKGEVRARIARLILDEAEKGALTALIARSADFYGPSVEGTSILTETVIKNLASGKKANWLGSDKFKHSFTYVPDAAKATALLGNTPEAFNQVWHLPTAPDPFTGKQWVEAIAKELNVNPGYRVVPKLMVRIMGVFMPIMKETVEMLYQYDRNYVFDSSKFEDRFGIKPTPYLEGIREIIKTDYSQ
jgi:nucleoside-diphosphate-sugar epimerase